MIGTVPVLYREMSNIRMFQLGDIEQYGICFQKLGIIVTVIIWNASGVMGHRGSDHMTFVSGIRGRGRDHMVFVSVAMGHRERDHIVMVSGVRGRRGRDHGRYIWYIDLHLPLLSPFLYTCT